VAEVISLKLSSIGAGFNGAKVRPPAVLQKTSGIKTKEDSGRIQYLWFPILN
jgi:hypothetical protein